LPNGGHRRAGRPIFEENLAGKVHLPAFTDDIHVLLPPGATFDIAKVSSRFSAS
jgi:hypothetical protein